MRHQDWRGKNYSFFQNKDCEFFPCHKVKNVEDFNCMFCYCPLYALGEKCGGNFKIADNGVKDCSECTFVHERDNFGKIIDKLYCD